MTSETILINSNKIVDDLNRWSVSFADFVFDCVTTRDEVRKQKSKIEYKEYIQHCCNLMQQEKLIIFEKSRRMMASWLSSAYILWVALFNPYTNCHWQGKKKEESQRVLENRVFFIYQHLPKSYPWPPVRTNPRGLPVDGNFELIHDASKNITSNIYSIAEGADQIRGETSSLVVVDEFAFQNNQIDALAAIGPATEGGGQVIIISTIKPGTAYELLCKDEL